MDAQRIGHVVGETSCQQRTHDHERTASGCSKPIISAMLVTMADGPPKLNLRGLSILYDVSAVAQ
jgi:hypothetical protein